MRTVTLICGPPGSGKTTQARATGLELYDLDDPHWQRSEKDFRAALRDLGTNPYAQAVVVRCAPTLLARQTIARQTQPTSVVILDVPLDECISRIRHRARTDPSIGTQIAAAKRWWRCYQPGDVDPTRPTRNTVAQGYGQEHRAERATWAVEVDAGRGYCRRCGAWLDPTVAWHLGHDETRTRSAPECVPCNDGAAARLGNARRRDGAGTASLRW